MNPEASPSLSEAFFQEILTVYHKFSSGNDELTIKFNEDISTVISKLFEILKRIEEVFLVELRKVRALQATWRGLALLPTT